jgi:site-specific DNA recombinase
MTPQTVVDGYIRVSVVGGREGERFQSPSAQREAIERWAEYRGATIGAIFEDLDQSGGTLKRPGLQAILARIESGETGGIVVSKIDRLSRSVSDGLATVEKITKPRSEGGFAGQVVSTSENIDTTTANGRLQLGVLLLMAQWYRDAATEQWADTQARALARGALPGRTPYGTLRRDDGRVSLHSDHAPIVARMVTERASGKGWKAIATGLTKDRIPTPNGNGVWAASTVQGIVESEACIGVFRGPAGARVDDAWPPMVARTTWEAAQLVKGKRDAERQYQDRLLAGLARCAGCRRTLKRTTNQHGHVSYGCTNRGCPSRASIGAVVLDTYVSGLVDAKLRAFAYAATEDTDDEYNALRDARDNATAEFERWRDDAEMRGVIGDADYRAGLAARAHARDETNTALDGYMRKARAGIPDIEMPDGPVSVTLAALPWATQRRVVEAYLRAVFVRRSARRGPLAARDASERTLIAWTGEREPPTFPSPTTGDLGPVAW